MALCTPDTYTTLSSVKSFISLAATHEMVCVLQHAKILIYKTKTNLDYYIVEDGIEIKTVT